MDYIPFKEYCCPLYPYSTRHNQESRLQLFYVKIYRLFLFNSFHNLDSFPLPKISMTAVSSLLSSQPPLLCHTFVTLLWQ